MNHKTISIFDTTLRDGDQWTGTPFMLSEKILVARMLAQAGMNVIEAWFARSRVDSGSIRSVVSEIGKWEGAPTIASLSRAGKEDIDASYQALQEASHPRIHTFIATSPLHMEKKLRMSPNQVLEAIRSSVSYATSTGMEVQWSAEDAANSEMKFLREAVIIAIESWARVINIPDTLWGSNPWHMERLFAYLTQETEYLRREWREFIFSVHPHNDNGLALANTLAAIRGWAQQVESTVLGIGERTGNLSMHQIVAYLRESGSTLIPGTHLTTTVRESEVFPVSHLVSRILGMDIRPNEPIIGGRTNSHGSWIHADGAIKWKGSAWVDPYSIIDTSKYWTPAEEKTFNARSWAAEVLEMLSGFIEVGNLSKLDVDWITTKATAMAERARGVYPSYLYALYLEEAGRISVESIEIGTTHTVSITLLVNGKRIHLQGESDSENGVISATMGAINTFLGKGKEFDVIHFSAEDRLSAWELAEKCLGESAQTARAYGGEAVGIVTFELEDWQGKKVYTRYACKNVEEASVRAIIYGTMHQLYVHCVEHAASGEKA